MSRDTPLSVGISGAKGGLCMPFILPTITCPPTSTAPELPAETNASASLFLTIFMPTTIDDCFFRLLAHDLVGKERTTPNPPTPLLPRLQVRSRRLSDASRLTRRPRALRLLNALIESDIRDLSHRLLHSSQKCNTPYHNHGSLLLLHQSLLKMLTFTSTRPLSTYSIPDIVSTLFLPSLSLEKPRMSSRTPSPNSPLSPFERIHNKEQHIAHARIQQTGSRGW